MQVPARVRLLQPGEQVYSEESNRRLGFAVVLRPVKKKGRLNAGNLGLVERY